MPGLPTTSPNPSTWISCWRCFVSGSGVPDPVSRARKKFSWQRTDGRSMQKLARNRVRKLEVAALAEGPARARILAVDDDERNLLAISEVLATIGEVICAQSGEE